MSSWTQPLCSTCWHRTHPDHAPVRVRNSPLEQCCFCGGPAVDGIYIRINPRDVDYPQDNKEPNYEAC